MVELLSLSPHQVVVVADVPLGPAPFGTLPGDEVEPAARVVESELVGALREGMVAQHAVAVSDKRRDVRRRCAR